MAEPTVVWISHRVGERCAGCAAEVFTGDFIQITRETGIRCATCAGLADLVYLPARDPALTRRAGAHLSRAVTVVKFSRARRRHERQGMLVSQGRRSSAPRKSARQTRPGGKLLSSFAAMSEFSILRLPSSKPLCRLR